METKILSILIAEYGWVYAEKGEIRVFEENGEMAKVKWYGQGKTIFNGKYVIAIIYE